MPVIAPTEADLAAFSQFSAGPVGAVLSGPGYGFDTGLTYAQFFVGTYGLYFLLATALMNILLISRHTRTEEQSGRAELVRAAGDSLTEHGSLLSWFSPLAWSQQTRPFVDGRWWPLLLSLGLAAVTTAGAFALAGRRDLGAGLRAARRGPAGVGRRRAHSTCRSRPCRPVVALAVDPGAAPAACRSVRLERCACGAQRHLRGTGRADDRHLRGPVGAVR